MLTIALSGVLGIFLWILIAVAIGFVLFWVVDLLPIPVTLNRILKAIVLLLLLLVVLGHFGVIAW